MLVVYLHVGYKFFSYIHCHLVPIYTVSDTFKVINNLISRMISGKMLDHCSKNSEQKILHKLLYIVGNQKLNITVIQL